MEFPPGKDFEHPSDVFVDLGNLQPGVGVDIYSDPSTDGT